jgi:hypothetical protein
VRTALGFFLVLITYGLLIMGTALLMPLHLSEITQAAAFLHFEWQSFFNWIAQTPAGAPLHYLVELPFALLAPDSKALLRVPALVSALGSVFVFFALAKRVPLRHPILALLLFLAIPTHLMYATQARPYELAMFLLLLATFSFFSLVEEPGFMRALIYTVALTACIFTQASSFLPSIGYALALLGFANLKTYRRALWYALAATALPIAIYMPYYFWAVGHRRAEWLTEQFPAFAVRMSGLQALMSLDPGTNPWFGIALISILLIGIIGGIGSTLPLASYSEGAPPPAPGLVRRRAIIFCLAGGALVAMLGQASASGWTGLVFSPYQILWSLPAFVIVFCAALDALMRVTMMSKLWLVGPALVIVAIFLCIPGDIEYLRTQPPDIAKLTVLVRPQLGGDTCVVFVSQRLSRYIFSVYDPDLAKYECQNFFHKRVVLAIHPFVRPEQEREARIFFRGLDFEETHRDVLGDGKVITMDATR